MVIRPLHFLWFRELIEVAVRFIQGRLEYAKSPVSGPFDADVSLCGTDLPAQISNPIGEVVLGWLEGDGLNLQLGM